MGFRQFGVWHAAKIHSLAGSEDMDVGVPTGSQHTFDLFFTAKQVTHVAMTVCHSTPIRVIEFNQVGFSQPIRYMIQQGFHDSPPRPFAGLKSYTTFICRLPLTKQLAYRLPVLIGVLPLGICIGQR
jgi:hypothetical protein